SCTILTPKLEKSHRRSRSPPEHPCALKAVDQAQPAYLLRGPEVLQGPYVCQHVRVGVDFAFPIRDGAERLLNGVSIDCKIAGRSGPYVPPPTTLMSLVRCRISLVPSGAPNRRPPTIQRKLFV